MMVRSDHLFSLRESTVKEEAIERIDLKKVMPCCGPVGWVCVKQRTGWLGLCKDYGQVGWGSVKTADQFVGPVLGS
jgi:hypothetical protein